MTVIDTTYSQLQSLLSQERWKEADYATGALLCTLTGRERHVVPEVVPIVRCEDLHRISSLWDQHSKGRYGFLIQARIWSAVGGMASVRTFEEMSEDERHALGLIENRFAFYVGHRMPLRKGIPERDSRRTDPTRPGYFPYGAMQCSYGYGLVGMLVAAFARRLLDCGLVDPVVFSDLEGATVPNVIAVLEDDAGRTSAMKDVLHSALPSVDMVCFDNAPDMIAWLTSNLANVCLLCLDHDLGSNRERDGERFDPGIGRDVVDFLITRAPAFSVIIHSSNSIGANGMVSALEGAGWTAERVVPYNDLAWVTERWNERVLSHINGES